MADVPQRIWHHRLNIRDTGIYEDGGRRIYTTAGVGYEKRPYILATPEALTSQPEVQALIRAAKAEGMRDGLQAGLKEAADWIDSVPQSLPNRYHYSSKIRGLAGDKIGSHKYVEIAANSLLDAREAFMAGRQVDEGQREQMRRLSLAASFAAAAYEAGEPGGQNVDALGRAFLLALIDPTHPDLDYLRADPASGRVARDANTRLADIAAEKLERGE